MLLISNAWCALGASIWEPFKSDRCSPQWYQIPIKDKQKFSIFEVVDATHMIASQLNYKQYLQQYAGLKKMRMFDALPKAFQDATKGSSNVSFGRVATLL